MSRPVVRFVLASLTLVELVETSGSRVLVSTGSTNVMVGLDWWGPVGCFAFGLEASCALVELVETSRSRVLVSTGSTNVVGGLGWSSPVGCFALVSRRRVRWSSLSRPVVRFVLVSTGSTNVVVGLGWWSPVGCFALVSRRRVRWSSLSRPVVLCVLVSTGSTNVLAGSALVELCRDQSFSLCQSIAPLVSGEGLNRSRRHPRFPPPTIDACPMTQARSCLRHLAVTVRVSIAPW